MRRIATLISLITVATAFAFAPVTAEAQWVLYDTFASGFIDPEKWFGEEFDSGPAAPDTETARGVLLGNLHMKLVSHGNSTSNTGAPGGRVLLGVTNPGQYIGLQASVAVLSARVEECPANTANAMARAQLLGGFFNDGSSTGPGDRTGDIIAGIQKALDSDLGNVFQAFIARCTNATCTASSLPAAHTFLGTWRLFATDVLRLLWHPANNQFIFTLNPGSPKQESVALGYSFPDAGPPTASFRTLNLVNSTPNCQGDQLRTVLAVRFDDVRVKNAQ